VQYGEVDSSTVRVFAIGSVGVDSFRVNNTEIHFAITNAGHGSGFAVGTGKMVATAKHVVDGAVHVVVRRPGDSGFSIARVLYVDPYVDIAILEIEDQLAPLALAGDASKLRVRSTVFAVGYPLDPTRKFAQSAKGIIAGNLDDGTLQIDMDINPGNSGGPLLDSSDRVVGIVVARARMGAGAQGIGYAVPATELAGAIAQAEALQAADGSVDPSDEQRQSAKVVDELVQAGALRSLDDASDLEGGLRGQKLEQSLGAISDGVRDPNLLAFIAGNLWNASLVLRYGEVEKIGDTQLTPTEARNLGDRMRKEAIRLAGEAHTKDPTIGTRSPFVDFARGQNVSHPSIDSASTPGRPAYKGGRFRAWGGFNVRVNPDTGTTGTGGFGGIGATWSRIEKKKGLVPFFGLGFGLVSFDSSDDPGTTFQHSYVSLELGGVARVTNRFELGAAYAPSFYASSVDDGESLTTAFVFGHVRGWASVVLNNFVISAGVRVLDGPTLWFEPVTVGVVF